ncbi:MAG: maleylpyruvate isomerase family mycothiol-dependent enzyme [Micromonosporaceae bacterium]|nr:maleylpyruvate isomerase family mycothiol-dependent enzyme [Micromonosporaceae bacterium]
MPWLEHERYESEFAAETVRFASVTSALDPAARVPTCPEWTVRDLVGHVGRGHRSATTIVGQRLTGPQLSDAQAPGDPDTWPEWLTSGAQGLIAAIREAGFDQPVWTWQRDGTAGFWLRRLLHDELVHRFDAEMTAGRTGTVATDLAADGICDLLDTASALSRYTGRPTGFRELAGTGETLRFGATDHPATWLAERTPDGVKWRYGDGEAAVSVSAPARELLLMLNRRVEPTPDRIQVTGDRTLLDHWLAHSIF